MVRDFTVIPLLIRHKKGLDMTDHSNSGWGLRNGQSQFRREQIHDDVSHQVKNLCNHSKMVRSHWFFTYYVTNERA